MRSYDIDGVITLGIMPEMPCIIVSGRLHTLTKETREQFKKLGVDPDIPIYLRPTGAPADRVLAGVWKATIINWAKVDEHIEDDELQASIIRSMTNARVTMIIPKQ